MYDRIFFLNSNEVIPKSDIWIFKIRSCQNSNYGYYSDKQSVPIFISFDSLFLLIYCSIVLKKKKRFRYYMAIYTFYYKKRVMAWLSKGILQTHNKSKKNPIRQNNKILLALGDPYIAHLTNVLYS